MSGLKAQIREHVARLAGFSTPIPGLPPTLWRKGERALWALKPLISLLGMGLGRGFLLILLLIIISIPVHAQNTPPLTGPLVATTPAQQDRILLHDMGDDGAVRQLQFGAGEIHVWDFSPDGCRVLFTRDENRDGLPKLYSAALDGSDVRALVTYDERLADKWGVWEPDWSPTGLIAFTMYRRGIDPATGEPLQTSHIAYIDGSGGVPDFYSVTGREFSPTWSPDGAWLAYVSYDERIEGEGPLATAAPTPTPEPGQPTPVPQEPDTVLEADMWVVSSDAATKYRLTAYPVGSVRHPRWSPDGALIGFVYAPSPSNDTLWMMRNDPNAEPQQLNFQWQLTLDHTWLPDGSAMLASIRNFREVDQNRLWRIPLEGDADTNDANIYITDDLFIYTDYPRFSADGRWLAFRSEYALIVYDVAGGTWLRLDTDLPGNTPPVWTPEAFAGEEACGT